jgi:hypothetical protein
MGVESEIEAMDTADVKDSETRKKVEAEDKAKDLEGEKGGWLSKIQGAFTEADNKGATADAKTSEAEEEGQKVDELQDTVGSTADKEKKEEAEKSLSAELDATKAKAAAGEKATGDVQAKDARIGELDNDLKSHGERLGDLSTKLKNLRQERDEAVSKAESNEEK